MLKQSILLSSSIALALGAASPAFAQSIDDEVIVTATKRATTLQETPVAVSVTNALTIERANIQDINDLQSVVPSLRINQLQSSQNTNFIIRGFGNGANNAGIEPSVGVFIDGVYRSRSAAAIGDLPKLERVEVLKGPQSTLFGKNASAGVISVVTAKPSYESEGYVELGYGNYNSILGKVYATGALGENVAGSIGAGINKRDGYGESIDPNLPDVNNRNRFNVRGQLLFEPTDNVSFRVIGDYSTLDESCCLVTNVVESVTSGIINSIGGPNTLADVNDPFTYTAFQNEESVNKLDDYGVSFHADVQFDAFDFTSITSFRGNESFYDTDADYGRLALLDSVNSDQQTETFTQEIRLTSSGEGNFDWMVGGFLFVEDVSQVGGLEYGTDLRAYIDALSGGALAAIEGFNGIASGTFFSADTSTVETFTQNDTAYSAFGTVDYHVSDRLTLTGGINYTNDAKDVTGSTVNTDAFSAIDLTGTAGFNTLVGLGVAGNFPNIALACTGTALPFSPANVGAVASVAACPGLPGMPSGGVAFAGLQQQVGAGVAALDLTNPAQNALLGLRAFQFQPQFLPFPNNVESGQTRDDKITWLARAAYEVSDSINIYASAATGFKASSWNLSRDSRPFPGDAAALTAGNLTQINQNYGTRYAAPEEVTVYELGVKTRFDNGTLNVAVFEQTLKDFQQNAFIGASFVLTNAGETKVRGVEWDSNYFLGDDFSINFAGTYLDAEYTDFANASGPIPGVPIDLTGETPTNISDLSLSVGANYNHDFANGMSGYIRGDWQYESPADLAGGTLSLDGLATRAQFVSIAATTNSYPGYDERSQSIFNTSAGLDLNNGLSLQVWARNLFNDQYFSTLFPGVAQEGIINAYPSQPRTYGVNARYKF